MAMGRKRLSNWRRRLSDRNGRLLGALNMNVMERANRKRAKKLRARFKKRPLLLKAAVHSYNKAPHEQPISPRQKRLSRLAENKARREAEADRRTQQEATKAAA